MADRGGPRNLFRNMRAPSFRFPKRATATKEQKAEKENQRRLTSQISFSDSEQFSFATDESWLDFCEDLTLDETK
jgi:hypothetical protein